MMIARVDTDTVVVPWSFTQRSLAALRKTANMIDRPEKILVVHVIPPLAHPVAGVHHDTADDQQARVLERRFREMTKVDPRLRDVSFHLLYGRVAAEIARFADKYRANVIVIPTRGPTIIGRWFGGSIAECLVRECKCPVLTLHDGELPVTQTPSGLLARTVDFFRGQPVSA